MWYCLLCMQGDSNLQVQHETWYYSMLYIQDNLVPRASFPLTSGRKTTLDNIFLINVNLDN